MLNKGDLLDNRYEIESKVGQGGMSYVYRARDTKLDRNVAIKVLKEEFASDESFVEKFRNEARSAARLGHPNIVTAYDTVDSGDLHYIVMELVEGITLKNYISRKQQLSNKETIGIAIQAAEGIAEAHRKGIIHRDIKPQNIIVSREGKVKVADFGIAKAVTGDSLTQSVLGSAHYISPEQARSGEADHRSDLYSLGITMYEMITGRVPYEGDNTVNIVMAHLQNAMVPPAVYNPEIYPALSDIIMKATRKDPEERYQSAEALIEDLKRASVEPESHFVKMYESVGSGALSKEEGAVKSDASETAKNSEAGDSRQQTGAGTASAGAEGTDPGSKQESGEDTEDELSLGKLLKKPPVLVVLLAVVILLGWLIGRVIGKTRSVPETTAAGAVSESTAEEEPSTETDLTLSIQGEARMPDLTGMEVYEAESQLLKLELNLDSSNTAYSDEIPEGRIIAQTPVRDEIVVPDTVVYVTVSLGPESNHVLSSLKNLTVEDAKASLAKVGVGVSNSPRMEFSEDVNDGYVIGYEELSLEEQEAEKESLGEEADGLSRIIRLIVSRGRVADSVIMPQLVGLSQTEAIALITSTELGLGAVYAHQTEETAPGIVVAQSVTPGEYVRKGTALNLQVSINAASGIPEGAQLPNTPVQTEGGSYSPGTGQQLSADYYYGSIDTVCMIGDSAAVGPGGSDQVIVAVRLVQRVSDSVEYTTIGEPIPVSPGTRIPVTYRNIRGAYGVDSGEIEVYNFDTNDVYGTYVITFAPLD